MGNYLATDDYLDFLRKNCGVRGYDFEERTPDCSRPDVNVILKYLKLLDIKGDDRLLEVGCGLGRILKEIHDRYRVSPYGIDMSEKVIDAARQRVAPIASDLRVCQAERIDHENAFFDKVLCWGTFDLTQQECCLVELSRVTKIGGLIMITGKHDNYHEDDQEAYFAEVDSRMKGIPNHFTDFRAMVALANELGLVVIERYFFERRGDFMNDIFQHELPEKFYEYLVIFRKENSGTFPVARSQVISSLYSETYRRRFPSD
jgi:ubiquinone/menaquinone biosynthesis C-methylase UbiE